MNIEYYTHRAFALMKRRVFPFLRIQSIAIILTLATLGAMSAYFGLNKEQERLARSLEITVMIHSNTDSSRIFNFADGLNQYAQIEKVSVISPKLATLEFEKELGTDTEGLFLETPFTWSIIFTLKPEYCDYSTLQRLLDDIKSKEIVEQTVFNANAAGAFFARSQMVLTLGLAGSIGSLIIFLGILSYVFRAELLQSPAEWFVLKTLGASRLFIALPHLIFAMTACISGIIIGGIVAISIANTYVSSYPWIIEVPLQRIFYSLLGLITLCTLTASATAMTATKGK